MKLSVIGTIGITVALISVASQSYAATTSIFRGDVASGISSATACFGLCGYNVPVVGSPISIVLALNAHLPPFSGSTTEGTDTLYDMTAPSFLDFGYGLAYHKLLEEASPSRKTVRPQKLHFLRFVK